MPEEKKKNKKSRSKANGEGTIYARKRNGKNYYTGTYVIGYNTDGKAITKSFCSSSKDEVINKMAEYKTQMNNGLTSTDEKITVEQWFYTWLFEYRINDLKATSFTKYEGIYRNHIKGTSIGKKKLSAIRATDLQSYYNVLLEEGSSPNVIKTINKHLKTCLGEAVKQGIIVRNYCTFVTLPKATESQEEEDDAICFFTVEEQQQFIASLDKHRNRAFFVLALGSGLRLGELLALKWNDIDFTNNTVSVTKAISQVSKISRDGTRTWSMVEHPPKTKSSIRTVPLPSKTIDALKKHQLQQNKEILKYGELYERNNLVFCTELGTYTDIRNMTRSYTRALAHTDIPHKKFHSLRHTYATRLFEKNIPPKKVQKLMGHSDLATTMNIYTHVMPEEMLDDVQCLNDILG